MRIRLVIGSWVALLVVAAESRAADRFWGNQFGGTFSSNINWQDGAEAGLNDVAHFGLTENPRLFQHIYVVDFSNNATNQNLRIEDDFVTFDLNGMTYATTLLTGNEIGNVVGRSGRLTITDGTMNVAANSNLSIGAAAGASGSLTVSTGGRIEGSPFVTVGVFGTGAATVDNGGILDGVSTVLGNDAGAIGTGTVTGGGSLWNSGALFVGSSGSGTLNVTAGGVFQNGSNGVGVQAGSTGTVNVNGVDSHWNNLDGLNLGDSGSGTLNLTAGGLLSSAGTIRVGSQSGGAGTINVDGTNTRWLHYGFGDVNVGVSGAGTLNITAGGRVINFQDLDASSLVGVEEGSTGAVTVAGANSEWFSVGELSVGHSGVGTLDINSGGRVQNTDGFVGVNLLGSGAVTVSDAHSQWVNSGRLIVGNLGGGTLNITAGGQVQSAVGFIGQSGVFLGAVTVTGAGSTWTNSSHLSVGASGSGTLTIADGGSVSSSDGVIGNQPGLAGITTVTGPGSVWGVFGRLSIGGDADTGIQGGTGALNIQAGGTVFVLEDTVLFPEGLLELDGGALGTPTIGFQGGEFQWTSGRLDVDLYDGNLSTPSGGTLAPGFLTRSTRIVGDYTQQAGGELEIEIGGPSGGVRHDLVDISGSAFLGGGELQLVMVNGFVPTAGDTFAVLDTVGGIFGVFINVANGQRLITVDGAGSFRVHYGPGSAFPQNQIILTGFVPGTPGDCDNNGHVDLADYASFPDCLGGPRVPRGPTVCECNDRNGDGAVDLTDFADLQSGLTGP